MVNGYQLSEDKVSQRKHSINILLYNQSNTRLKRTLVFDEAWMSLWQGSPLKILAESLVSKKPNSTASCLAQSHIDRDLYIIGVAFGTCIKKETDTAKDYK